MFGRTETDTREEDIETKEAQNSVQEETMNKEIEVQDINIETNPDSVPLIRVVRFGSVFEKIWRMIFIQFAILLTSLMVVGEKIKRVKRSKCTIYTLALF